MKIVAEPGKDNVEGTLCDVARQAEILKDLLIALEQRMDAKDVPKAFMKDVECATFAAFQMREMMEALKVEYYADIERKQKAA